MAERPGWQCCFCGQGIEPDDPLAVAARLTNIHADIGPETPVQTVYTHDRCIAARLTRSCCFEAETLLPD